jgi:hypothetical protein
MSKNDIIRKNYRKPVRKLTEKIFERRKIEKMPTLWTDSN